MRFFLSMIIVVEFCLGLKAQNTNYSVSILPFCSKVYDEFGATYFNDGIVFCSNKPHNQLVRYASNNDKGPVKIYFAETLVSPRLQDVKLFAKELTSNFNDGPVSFNKNQNIICFSRNIKVERKLSNISDIRNKLGLFFMELAKGKWTKIKEFRYNSDGYNITTPCLSADGKRLYYASDMPGGYGGFDLYYSEWKNDYWDKPVNLGPKVNSAKNELYPFILEDGSLYFSSDGHPGLGGKDIYYTKLLDSVWQSPIDLSAPINSPQDDYGFIINDKGTEGYFSSTRGESADIYKFSVLFPQLFYCTQPIINKYCYSFQDSFQYVFNDEQVTFNWDFGDGRQESGTHVDHCFREPGKYFVREQLIDEKSKRIFFQSYSFILELKESQMLDFSSPASVTMRDTAIFDGRVAKIPGNTVLRYYWDFGDGQYGTGSVVKHTYEQDGEYQVKLGLVAQIDSNRIIHQDCIMKNLSVGMNEADRNKEINTNKINAKVLNSEESPEARVINLYSLNQEFSRGAVFTVNVETSKSRIDIRDKIFDKLKPKYRIREFRSPDGQYQYSVCTELNLVDCLPCFRDVLSMGYNSAFVTSTIPDSPFEHDLTNLKKVYGLNTDTYFQENDTRLTTDAYPFILQLINLLLKYPDAKIEIDVHTDNQGNAYNSARMSQKRAENIAAYMVSKGINESRIKARGMGSTRPIASNSTENGRKKNRRIDIVLQ